MKKLFALLLLCASITMIVPTDAAQRERCSKWEYVQVGEENGVPCFEATRVCNGVVEKDYFCMFSL